MTWKLWIDDDAGKEGIADWRNPPKDESDWKVARNSCTALLLVSGYGPPEFIDFDHDLGINHGAAPDSPKRNDTAMKFLKDYEEMYPDAILEIKDYHIHSANLEGAKNIHAFMSSWRRSKDLP